MSGLYDEDCSSRPFRTDGYACDMQHGPDAVGYVWVWVGIYMTCPVVLDFLRDDFCFKIFFHFALCFELFVLSLR